MKPLARYGGMTAHATDDGTVVVDGLPEPLEVRAGDRLVLTWGGMGAAIGVTPIDLDHVSGSRWTSLVRLQLLDEHDVDWRTELDAVRAFAGAIAAAVGITVEDN